MVYSSFQEVDLQENGLVSRNGYDVDKSVACVVRSLIWHQSESMFDLLQVDVHPLLEMCVDDDEIL